MKAIHDFQVKSGMTPADGYAGLKVLRGSGAHRRDFNALRRISKNGIGAITQTPTPHSIVHFACRDQFTATLSPARVQPCWAHETKHGQTTSPTMLIV